MRSSMFGSDMAATENEATSMSASSSTRTGSAPIAATISRIVGIASRGSSGMTEVGTSASASSAAIAATAPGSTRLTMTAAASRSALRMRSRK